jgi:hypothetical protein
MEATNAKLKEAAKALTGDIDTLTNAMTVEQLASAAQEIAGHIKAGEDHSAEDFKAAGRRLLEVQKQLREQDGSFNLFLKKHKKEVGARSKCFQWMALASGKTTVDEIRAEDRKRAQAQRDRNREAREAVRASRTTKPDINYSDPDMPGAGGNTGDPVAEAKQRKADNEKLATGITSPAAKSTSVDLAAIIADKDARSRAALKKLNATIDECLPEMNTTEKQAAFEHFKFHPKMVGVPRKAA